MPEQFYVRSNDDISGPYSAIDLKRLAAEKKMGPEDFISGDQQKWYPANSVRGLIFPGTEGPDAPPAGFDVFISYSSFNKLEADAICAKLEESGVRCWIAPRNIQPGGDWAESIIIGIKSCRLMVLVFSKHANDSPQVLREVERAINNGLVIIPFRIENVSPVRGLEYFLGATHWLDAFDPPIHAHFQKLLSTVRAILSAKPESAPYSTTAAKGHSRRLVWMSAAGALVLAVLIFFAVKILLPRGADSSRKEPQPPSVSAADDYQKLYKADMQGKLSDFIQANGPTKFSAWKTEADGGDAHAAYLVALCYSFGTGVSADSEEYAKWLKKAADQGLPMAMCDYGETLLPDMSNHPKAEAFAEWLKWIQKAADAGEVNAMRDLAFAYARGDALPTDGKAAAQWAKKAAEAGDDLAMSMLGSFYDYGVGVPVDHDLADKWYEKPALAGDARCMLKLAWRYKLGQGVPVDITKGVNWERRAAEAGDAEAMYLIGKDLDDGIGVNEDPQEAMDWYRKSANAGYDPAKQRILEGMKTKISDADKARIEQIVPDIHIQDQSLMDSLHYLSDLSGINIVARWKEGDSAGIDPFVTVTVKLQHVTIKKVLEEVLADANEKSQQHLRYKMDGGVITIYIAR